MKYVFLSQLFQGISRGNMLKIPSFFLRERLRVNRKRQYVLSKKLGEKDSRVEIHQLRTNRTIPVKLKEMACPV